MTEVKVTVSARPGVSLVRADNEDAFLVAELTTGARLDAIAAGAVFDLPDAGLLLAVSDGLGGPPGDEIASSVALESVLEALMVARAGPLEAKLESALQLANAAVLHSAQVHDMEVMGATLTAVLVSGEAAYVAQVGGARAYLCRGGGLCQLTPEHSPVPLPFDDDPFSSEDAEDSLPRNVIGHVMGGAEQVYVAVGRLALRRLDTLLVCSDGVSNAMSADEILRILSWHEPRSASARLVNLAALRGGGENLSLIVAQFDGPGLPPSLLSESLVDVFEVLH